MRPDAYDRKMAEWTRQVRARIADDSDYTVALMRQQLPKPEMNEQVSNPDGNLNSILAERHESYGKFEDNAALAQMFKGEFRGQSNFVFVAQSDQREALDMIASKISRLLSGDINHLDSWKDIAGYATLVAERLQGRAK